MTDDMTTGPPVLGICGFSGSGKTTLLEGLLPLLRAKGLRAAVVKSSSRDVDVDHPGKDSDRLFRAGADVLLKGPREAFLRLRRGEGDDLPALLAALEESVDLVLLEGHKAAEVPKVWILSEGEQAPPAGLGDIIATVAPEERSADRLLGIVWAHLARRHLETPLVGCVLIGGKSSRMGRPKHLLERDGHTWLGQTAAMLRQVVRRVVIVGAGEVPAGLADCLRLPDAPDAQGPMAGLLSAMRWAPRVTWLLCACDLPNLTVGALEWLRSARAPGVWATLPRLPGRTGVEPLLAHYDFRIRPVIEHAAAAGNFSLSALAGHPKVISPVVPSHLAGCWANVNTPSDLDELSRA